MRKKVVSGMRKEAQQLDTDGLYTTESTEPIHGSIREVVSANRLDEETLHGNQFERLYEESLKGFREGTIIQGSKRLSMMGKARHYMNPLHVYCRLRGLGVSHGTAKYVCRSYERYLFQHIFLKKE
jgi:hypothetical protein